MEILNAQKATINKLFPRVLDSFGRLEFICYAGIFKTIVEGLHFNIWRRIGQLAKIIAIRIYQY